MAIDVVMPFYGDLHHLRLAIASVQAQDSDGWRLTVVDDHYPGTSHRDYLDSISDPRVRTFRNEVNLGVAGNFARCLALADAEWVVFMGCDDIMLPGYISHVARLIEAQPGVDYVQPGVRVIDSGGRVVRPLGDRVKTALRPGGGPTRILQGERVLAGLLTGNWTYFPSICWRVSSIRRFGFRADYGIVLDLALQVDVLASGGSLLLDDDVVFEYRRHEASASSWTRADDPRFLEEARVFSEIAARFDERGWRRAGRAARRHWTSRLNAVTQLPRALRAGDRSGIRSLMRHAFA